MDTKVPSARARVTLVLPAAVYVVAIFGFGSMRGGPSPPVELSDKLMHLVGFMPAPPLFVLALRAHCSEWSRLKLGWVSVGLASLVGALLELWQALLPYRSCELLDWVADSVGALLSLVLLELWWRAKRPGESLT